MNKQAILSKFLTQVHGKRLIQRGLHNTVAYYNLPKGVAKANRYGDVTFYPCHDPQDSYTVFYAGQFDLPVEKQAVMF
jgi:hypothetical protein